MKRREPSEDARVPTRRRICLLGRTRSPAGGSLSRKRLYGLPFKCFPRERQWVTAGIAARPGARRWGTGRRTPRAVSAGPAGRAGPAGPASYSADGRTRATSASAICAQAASKVFERPVVQRLGYLLTRLGYADRTDPLHAALPRPATGWVELDPAEANDPDPDSFLPVPGRTNRAE